MSGYKFPMSQPSLFTPDAHTFYASVNSNTTNKKHTSLFLWSRGSGFGGTRMRLETLVSRGNLPSLEKELVTNFGQGGGVWSDRTGFPAGCSLLVSVLGPVGPGQGGSEGDCWSPETSVGTGG